MLKKTVVVLKLYSLKEVHLYVQALVKNRQWSFQDCSSNEDVV